MTISSKLGVLLGSLGLVAVAACSDGGSGGSGGEDRPTFDDLADLGDAIDAESLALDYTQPTTLPGSGSATYEGMVALDTVIVDGSLQDSPDLIGELTMTASFGSNAIGGQATNFVSETDETFDGTLPITDGLISRNVDVEEEYTFGAIMDGELTDEGGDTYDFFTDLSGDFLGTDYGYVYGSAEGVACAATCSPIEGQFIGER